MKMPVFEPEHGSVEELRQRFEALADELSNYKHGIYACDENEASYANGLEAGCETAADRIREVLNA